MSHMCLINPSFHCHPSTTHFSFDRISLIKPLDIAPSYIRQSIRDLEISQQRAIKDMKNCHAMERSSLEQRDLQNAQEIETLHRKCRCLTKL